jgi:hypothetical protein
MFELARGLAAGKFVRVVLLGSEGRGGVDSTEYARGLWCVWRTGDSVDWWTSHFVADLILIERQRSTQTGGCLLVKTVRTFRYEFAWNGYIASELSKPPALAKLSHLLAGITHHLPITRTSHSLHPPGTHALSHSHNNQARNTHPPIALQQY